jgi:hypothetical protein
MAPPSLPSRANYGGSIQLEVLRRRNLGKDVDIGTSITSARLPARSRPTGKLKFNQPGGEVHYRPPPRAPDS